MDNPKGRNERGQSLVELALSFTFMLFLLAGATDLGRLMFSYVSIHDAAQEGVSYAAVDPTQGAKIRSRVKTYSDFPLNLNNFPDTDIDILVDGAVKDNTELTQSGVACAGDEIEVRVSYDVEILTPLLGPIVGSDHIPLEAYARETILTPKCP